MADLGGSVSVIILRHANDGNTIEVKAHICEDYKHHKETWQVCYGAIYSRSGPDLDKMCDEAQAAYERWAKRKREIDSHA